MEGVESHRRHPERLEKVSSSIRRACGAAREWRNDVENIPTLSQGKPHFDASVRGTLQSSSLHNARCGRADQNAHISSIMDAGKVEVKKKQNSEVCSCTGRCSPLPHVPEVSTPGRVGAMARERTVAATGTTASPVRDFIRAGAQEDGRSVFETPPCQISSPAWPSTPQIGVRCRRRARLFESSPQTPLASEQRTQEVVVLYASPLDRPLLDFRLEIEMLRDSLECANMKLLVGTATADSLIGVFARARSSKDLVLHLSAHSVDGERTGLVLEGKDGREHILWRDQLDELLAAHETELRRVVLVFLSTCGSYDLAKLFIDRGCRHVIGVKGEVLDRAARKFAESFFMGLATGASLTKAFESARVRLRIDPDHKISKTAGQFVLLEADNTEPSHAEMVPGYCGASHNLEDVDTFLSTGMPSSSNAYIVHRSEYLLRVQACFACHKACVIHGEVGIGKRVLGQEFARFAAAPGRMFSCCAVTVDHFQDVRSLTLALEAELGHLCAFHLGNFTGFQGVVKNPVASIIHSLHQLEDIGRRGVLLVINDRAGVISGSAEARDLLGEILERARWSYVLVCSRSPVFGLLGPGRAVNIQVLGLGIRDAARLFLKCVNRPLVSSDFEGEPTQLSSAADLWRLLTEHPLLDQLKGNPRRICEVAAERVVPNGAGLLELSGRES